jgi:pyruvate-formate lyase-activating enzyme
LRVLLVHLPLARRSYLSRFSLVEPMGQLYLGPALAPRHEVRLVDLRVTPFLDRELGMFVPDAAVVGTGPLVAAACERTLSELRHRFPKLRILLVADAEYGNAHVSDRPRDFVHPLADALVQPHFLAPLSHVVRETLAAWEEGRSIASVPGLLRQASPGIWTQTETAPNVVGEIGVLDRTLLGRARGRYRFAGIGRMAHLFYTYGCRFKCRFCPMSKHDGTVVARSIPDVIAELRAMTEPNVYLEDFEPFLAPEAMAELADAVEREGIRKNWYMLTRSDTAQEQEALIRRWKGLGLRWLYLGLDGFSLERLKEIKKANTVAANEEGLRRMQALGLCVSVGFVVRPDFTREDFAQLRAYVRRLKAPLVAFTVETPLVGTRLHDEEGSRITTRDWSLFDLSHAVLPTALPLDDFYRELARLQFAAGLRTLPAMLRHFPLRDTARIWASGIGALNDLRRSARDHEGPLGGTQARSHGAVATAHA